MKAFIANLQTAVRNRESVLIGGGEFNYKELSDVISQIKQLQTAAELAHEALEWAWGGEPMGSKEFEALQALRQIIKGGENA